MKGGESSVETLRSPFSGIATPKMKIIHLGILHVVSQFEVG